MGIICELYRIKDATIDELKAMPAEQSENFLLENYASIYGIYHHENDTVFSMDKGWAITRFLIQQCDASENNCLSLLDEHFLKSDAVKELQKELSKLEISDLQTVYNKQKLITNNIYRGDRDFSWDYIKNFHFKVYQVAFQKAVEYNDGIVTYIEF
tara:strand:+ start:4860 stop:5327 length:468 start_codon:yes stop_codon:yes gene_type:complete